MGILKGTIFLTDDPQVIYNSDLNITKIISLDEDGFLMDNPAFVVGTCLLPPPEAKIAEVDNNEQLYDVCYNSHLLEPFQQQFMGAVIASLYSGYTIIIFLPEMGYTYTREKIVQHIWTLYGIHIGFIGAQDPTVANCFYDEKCAPIWMNMIYLADVMDSTAFLYYYPADAVINNTAVKSKLIFEMQPYGNTVQEKEKEIERFRRRLHDNKNVKQVIHSI